MRDWARAGVVAGARGMARWRPAAWRTRTRAGAGAPRIVLVRPDHVGDVLLSTPAIAALRAALPTAHLTALVGPWAADVLVGNPHLDAVHTVMFPGFARDRGALGWHAYTAMWREAQHVRAGRYDAAVILRPDFWWGAAMLALADVPVRVGFDVWPGNQGLTHWVDAPRAREHAVRRSLRLVEAAAWALAATTALDGDAEDMTAEQAPLVFQVGEADRQWADGWLARHGLLDEGLGPILAHPGSGALIKLWPPVLWGRALEQLAGETGAPLVVAGSRGEAALVAEVARTIGGTARVHTFAEDVSLGRYAALLERARLVLGVDSGPLHLAAALGRPSVRLHGPSDAAVFGPWGMAGLHGVVASHLPCAPCGRLDYKAEELNAHPCMRLLTPAAVVAMARDVLAAAEGGPEQVHPILHRGSVENTAW